MKITGISFSYSKDSMALRGLFLMDSFLHFYNLHQINLPFCNSNKPNGLVPQSVQLFIDIICDADILVFSVPEYSEHYSAAFKNALDWLVVEQNFNSSLGQDYCITNKPIYVITFTPAKTGAGDRHFEMTTHILKKLGADIRKCFVKNNGWQEVVPNNFKFVEQESNEILNTLIVERKQSNEVDLKNEVPEWINKYEEWNNKWS